MRDVNVARRTKVSCAKSGIRVADRCSPPTHLIDRLKTAVLIGLLVSSGCELTTDSGTSRARSATSVFRIVSGSENKQLEPIIKKFGRQKGIQFDIDYLGSVEISSLLATSSNHHYDAVWPAASLWIALGDSENHVKHRKSIMRSPVVFAVRKSIATKNGWDKPAANVTMQEILKVVEEQKIRFAMTSATQSNSGASWYLGCISAFAGQPEVMTSEILNDATVAANVRRFLAEVNRSSGSSGWLRDLIVERYDEFDGMVNYEALVIEANKELTRRGDEPLYCIYPVDGLTLADSPLGYVDRGSDASEECFLQLQEHLLSPEVQAMIGQLGRRTSRLGSGVNASATTTTFNPAWGIDVERILSPIRLPTAAVIKEALSLYQSALRKPSLTAYVLDFSGSMQGLGEIELESAMRTLLDQQEAEKHLLHASDLDVTVVIPFNSHPGKPLRVDGNSPQELISLLNRIVATEADGGTNIYRATRAAMQVLMPLSESGQYHTSVIVMSDGQSDGSISTVASYDRSIPVFTILFGDADETQMKRLADRFGGRMFDGREDVIRAFRMAKGYN